MRLRKNRYYRRRIYRTGWLFNIGPTVARYLVLLTLALFSVLFLFGTSESADQTIELQRLEQRKNQLDAELTTLELNAARSQSLKELSEYSTNQGLVPIDGSLETLFVNPD